MKKDSHVRGVRSGAVFALGLLMSLTVTAQIRVGWHDDMYLQLGDGVKLNHQQEPAMPALVRMSAPGSSGDGGVIESLTFAQSTYDFVKGLSANSAASLNSLVFSGDVNVSFFGKQTFNANDLTFGYTATHDFGSPPCSALSFSSNFWSRLPSFQRNLEGQGLHEAITGLFGSHYVAGYHLEAQVSVVYSFHFTSASAKQRWSVSASGTTGLGSFSSFVNNIFNSTNTAVSMSYQFYSSDPFLLATNFGFASAGTIKNAQDYSSFLSRVRNYAYAMTQDHARVVEYVLQPLKTVPGYLEVLGGYIPPDILSPGYDSFLQAYTKLQAWKQQLDRLILNGDSLNWLNSQGRQVVQSSWLDAANYLAAMKNIAREHFSSSGPLTIPANIADYLNNLNELSLPQIFNLKTYESGSATYFIGQVDSGCRDLVVPIPFANLSERYNQAENGTLVSIYYNAADFEKAAYAGSVDSTLKTFFAGETWACVTNSANPHLNGFFLTDQPTKDAPNWSLVITGGIDVNGEPAVVDEMMFLDPTAESCPPPACTIKH